MALVKGGEDGPLVGKVLVERSDADARRLRDAVRREAFGAVTLQHPRDRLEDGPHRLPGALLLGLATRERSFAGLHERLAMLYQEPRLRARTRPLPAGP